MTEYQSLFGTSTLRVDYIAAGQIQADELILPNGAQDGFILTSDMAGVASWQPDPNTELAGDANGPLLSNTITTLAGGTLNVSDLVTLTGNQTIQNKIIDESNTVIASILRNGAGTFQLSIEGDSPTTNQILSYKDGFIKFIDLDLEGDVTSVGPTTKVQAVGGSTAEQIHNAEQLANAATSSNTANAIVKRDSNGNFSAGTITADLNGNAASANYATKAGNAATADLATVATNANYASTAGNSATVTTNANLTGEVTSIGNAATLTNAAVISKLLTGFSATTGTVTASDSLLTFANKTTGNIAALSSALTGVSTATPNRLALRDSSANCSFNDVSISRLLYGGTYILDTSQTNNTLFGLGAGNRSISGTQNTLGGYNCGNGLTSGSYNTGFGCSTLQATTTGVENAAYGENSLSTNSTGSYNTGFGTGSLAQNTTGGASTALGNQALGSSKTGTNTAVGFHSGLNITNGGSNTFLGANTGQSATTNSQCTLLGDTADVGSASVTNSTAIGFNAQVLTSNTIQLGNAAVSVLRVPYIISTAQNSGVIAFPGSIAVSGNAFAGTTTTGHLIGTPSGGGVVVSNGPASAPSGSAYVDSPTVVGTDAAGLVTILTWPSGLTNGIIMTVYFGKTYSSTPFVSLTPAHGNAAGIASYVFVQTYVDRFVIITTSTLTTSRTYAWFYSVIG